MSNYFFGKVGKDSKLFDSFEKNNGFNNFFVAQYATLLPYLVRNPGIWLTTNCRHGIVPQYADLTNIQTNSQGHTH